MKIKIGIAILALATASVVAQQTTEKPGTAQPTPDQHMQHMQGHDQHAMHGDMKGCCKKDAKGEMKCAMMSKDSKMECCKGKGSETKTDNKESMGCCKGMMAKAGSAKMECCKGKTGEAKQCGKEEKSATEKPTGTLGELPAKN